MQELVSSGVLTEHVMDQAKEALELHVFAQISKQQQQRFAQDKTAFQAKVSPTKWLEEKEKFIEVGGQDLAISDLLMFSEEDVATVSAAMTGVEAKRFTAVLHPSAAGRRLCWVC